MTKHLIAAILTTVTILTTTRAFAQGANVRTVKNAEMSARQPRMQPLRALCSSSGTKEIGLIFLDFVGTCSAWNPSQNAEGLSKGGRRGPRGLTCGQNHPTKSATNGRRAGPACLYRIGLKSAWTEQRSVNLAGERRSKVTIRPA